MTLGLVWAQAHDGVIGASGTMPWRVPEDLAHFKDVTMGAPVIMGRRTWDSLSERYRPLPGRRNIVVTRNASWGSEGAERAGSLQQGLALTSSEPIAWVIGGGELYREALPLADVLEVTELDIQVEGDTFAPAVGPEWADAEAVSDFETSRSGIRYRFRTYRRAL